MSKAKILKYTVFGLLYSILVLEIASTSGLVDPRSLFWPSTPGYFTGIRISGKLFACYAYQYNLRGTVMQGSQVLPQSYNDTLKPGQIVRVYYNTDDPEKSFFAPGFNPTAAFCLLFVIILGICLLLIPTFAWVSASKKN